MKMYKFFVVLIALFVVGCAQVPQQYNVSVDFSKIQKSQKIGLYVSPIPKISTSFPGASCLLCLGAAAVANSSLTKQVETFQAENLAKTRDILTQQLTAKGYQVVQINEPIADKKLKKVKAPAGSDLNKDYSPYKTQFGIDQLVMVNINLVVLRNYSAYVPQGAPYASGTIAFYMIDLSTNEYSFYSPIKMEKAPDGQWDSPPKFPAVTNAFYQMEEELFDKLSTPFK